MSEAPATPSRRLFAANVHVRRREERIDLALAALLIARDEYPNLVIEDYLERLDQLAMDYQISLDADVDALGRCRALGEFLAGEEGFNGDSASFTEPRNNYLNEVMDRRKGQPISLSLIYLEVARRANLALQPVSFPGHFLVKHPAPDGDIILDPFNGGRIVQTEDCRALLKNPDDFSADMLAATTKRQLLRRLLNNLKSVYLRRMDYYRALKAVELLVSLAPWDLEQLRDRGVVRYMNADFDGATRDLERYLENAPPGANLKPVLHILRLITPL